jgi:hypothetical protein
MKFKKGDQAIITDDSNLRHLRIMDKVTIKIVDPLSTILTYYVEDINGIGQWVSENQIA